MFKFEGSAVRLTCLINCGDFAKEAADVDVG